MPRPKSLTQTDIAAAALAVADRDGLAAMSMRTVAAELGMGTMSLYRYVSDRDQLERLIVDHVLAGVDLTPPPRAAWTRQVATLAERVRAALAAHPEVVPLTVTHRHASTGTLQFAERVLAILTEAGFTGRRRVIALRSLFGYINGAIQLEHLGPLAGGGTDTMAALPAEDFPYLTETARTARRVPAGDEFRGGLEVLMRGLRASAGADGRVVPRE